MCISVPYGNTEGPVGYTSVRRLQHVHVWMRVDVSRVVCDPLHGSYVLQACGVCPQVLSCKSCVCAVAWSAGSDGAGERVREATSLTQ